MEDVVKINLCIEYADSDGIRDSLQVVDLTDDVVTEALSRFTMTALTTDTPIVSAGVVGFGWLALLNLDETNYVDVRATATGDYFARLHPGMPLLLYIGPGMTIPQLKAHTASCRVLVQLIQI